MNPEPETNRERWLVAQAKYDATLAEFNKWASPDCPLPDRLHELQHKAELARILAAEAEVK